MDWSKIIVVADYSWVKKAEAEAIIDHLNSEIERLREECAALRDEVELKSAALTGTSRSMGEEIERLRDQLAAMERGYKSFRDTAEVEFTRLRGLLHEGSDNLAHNRRWEYGDWIERVRDALGDER